MYSKRAGTSGIRGALYETKLLCLLYLRAIHDGDIENFQLASNVDKIGAFDDICFKAKVKGFDKPVAVFIQAKHRENEKQTLKIDLATYFNSYMNIRQLFHPSNNDLFFRGTFDETECLFVIYTNAKIEVSDDSVGSDFSAKLKDLIDTRDNIQQLDKYEENIDYRIISVEDQVTSLAKRIATFITGKENLQMVMADEHVLRYHVILAHKVFDISEIQPEGYRMVSFRNDFFDTNEEHLILFKDTLFKDILKSRTITHVDIRLFLSEFLANPTDARKEMLLSVNFKVPAWFGNKDLTISGSDLKIERRINYLAYRINELLDYCKSSKMVTIDESLDGGFLQLNGGIAGAIGNIFVLDDNTKLMKITDSEESLGTLATRLYRILNSENHNLYEYKFCFKVDKFPKLSFECIQIDTRSTVKQPHKYENNIENLTKIVVKDQITALSERIVKYITGKENFQIMLTDEHVLRYHVILAQKVFDISEIQPEGYRMASFRKDFFDTNEEHLILFKDTFCKEILKRRTIKPADIRFFLSEFLADPTDARPLSKLIGTIITYNNGQLEFDKQSIKYCGIDMEPMKVSLSTVNEAIELAAKEILLFLHFKVPAAFGNKDLTIRGNDAVKERRINYLASLICDLLVDCKYSKRVTIQDGPIKVGFLQLNGGIAGAIGNIFVLDDNTKLMKVTDNWESLETLAKKLYTKLKSEIHNLNDYKFCFKVDTFPKLSFGEYEENLVRDFLKKIHFYYNQANEKGVEEIIKVEIEDYQHNQPYYFQVKTDAIFSKYLAVIQEWWMQPQNSCLTRESDLFQHTINNIIKDPLMSSINLTYMNKLQQYNYTFTEDAVRSLNLQDQHSSTVIVAENSVLTVAKVMQHLKNKDHVVLDLQYIANLPTNDQNALRSELKYMNEGRVLILVCDKIDSENEMKILQDIAKAVLNRRSIIITNQTPLRIIKRCFPKADDILYDKKLSLVDLSKESQETIFKTATAIFPGGKIRFDLLLRGWPKTGPK